MVNSRGFYGTLVCKLLVLLSGLGGGRRGKWQLLPGQSASGWFLGGVAAQVFAGLRANRWRGIHRGDQATRPTAAASGNDDPRVGVLAVPIDGQSEAAVDLKLEALAFREGIAACVEGEGMYRGCCRAPGYGAGVAAQ